MHFKYVSTKTYHQAFPCAYRQWRADSHCNVLHGYAFTIHLEFGANSLDARNWIVDFGGVKTLKAQLETWFDHSLLVAMDDPHREVLENLGKLGIAKIHLVDKTGCEGLADALFEYINDLWIADNGYKGRVVCTKVEVRETQANMAMRCLIEDDPYKVTE